MSSTVTERPRTTTRTATRAATRTATRTGGRTAGRARVTTVPGPRTAPGPEALPAATPSRGAGRASTRKAYARRDDRLRRLLGGGPERTPAGAGRAQFVLLVVVLLGVGLVATLWLSTAAAADSYQLQDARANAAVLTAQSERLHREVSAMDSAPALAQRAAQLGMVPVQDPARIVVGSGGAVTVVGVPAAAAASASPTRPAAGSLTSTPVDPAAAPGGGAPAVAKPGAPTSAAAPSTDAAQAVTAQAGVAKPGSVKPGAAKPGAAKPAAGSATTGPTSTGRAPKPGAAARPGAAAPVRTAGTG